MTIAMNPMRRGQRAPLPQDHRQAVGQRKLSPSITRSPEESSSLRKAEGIPRKSRKRMPLLQLLQQQGEKILTWPDHSNESRRLAAEALGCFKGFVADVSALTTTTGKRVTPFLSIGRKFCPSLWKTIFRAPECLAPSTRLVKYQSPTLLGQQSPPIARSEDRRTRIARVRLAEIFERTLSVHQSYQVHYPAQAGRLPV